jgi:PKD repeat protein
MKAKTFLILSIWLLAATCQKRKYPEEKVQIKSEGIYSEGTIGGESFSLRIGTDGYYCYSSYEQRPDSIYVFEGELKKFDCNPCPLSLRVELSDYKKHLPGASVNPDSALRTGSRNFIPGLTIAHTLKFVSTSNKEVAFRSWETSTGSSSQSQEINFEFSQPGPQTVSLSVRTTGNCETRVVNTIYFGGTNGLFTCNVVAEHVQNNISKFKPNIVGGKAPFMYSWDFGDGGTSTVAEPSHDYLWAGSYPVKLRIEDAEGHVCESNYIHIAGNDISSCASNMSLSYVSSRNVFFNGVRIQWTDKSNTILSSDVLTQPPGAYFEVVNSQPYEANERGEAGRLLTLRFNVLLSDGKRNLWFKSDHTSIAVTYK